MSHFNKTLVSFLSLFPESFIQQFASRYVAGSTWEEAVQAVRNLNNRGFSGTLDILGEHSRSLEEIKTVKQAYLQLYETIEREGLDCNISLKLTHLGLGTADSLAEKGVLEILDKAKEKGNFLRIDMEDSRYTDAAIRLFKKCFDRYRGVGLVLQSYLRRSGEDLAALAGKKLNVRICKGIYNESQDIAYQDRDEIRKNFIHLVQAGLSNDTYIAIATHDLYLVDSLETWIVNKKIPQDAYEFQVLYGVPMRGRLQSLIKGGHKVRVYVPFGEDWYSYAMRRLEENPHMVGYILKNAFRRAEFSGPNQTSLA